MVYDSSKYTTIAISKKTHKKLVTKKLYKRETLNSVVDRVLEGDINESAE